VPPRVLGSLVGGMIILTNARTLLRSDWIAAPGPTRAVWYAAIAGVWVVAVLHSTREHLATRQLVPEPVPVR
jgi:hypothetical protein